MHIQLRALHIAEHQHAAPFGDGDACGKLAYAQRYRLVVGLDGRLHLIISLDGFLVVIQLSVACRQHHFVVLKAASFLFQQFGQGLGAIHSVEQP